LKYLRKEFERERMKIMVTRTRDPDKIKISKEGSQKKRKNYFLENVS